MRSLEDLLNDVRDPASRPHVREAIAAYNAGAFRAAIISTWVAVALDLVSKIRELADQGDGAGKAWVAKLDRAIASSIPAELQKIEAELLEVAKKEFSLLNEREQTEISRLRDDRHVCAHPAFVDVDKVFTPTPELVRLHLASAVSIVLSQPPTPGKKVLERFTTESRSLIWPRERVDLVAYLRVHYLDRGRQSLREGIAKVAIKGVMDPPEGDEGLTLRLAEVTHALEEIDPELLRLAFQDVLTRRLDTGGITTDEALKLIGRLGDIPTFWDAVPASMKPSLVAAIASAPLPTLAERGVLSTPQGFTDAANAVLERLPELTQGDGQRDALVLALATEKPPLLLWDPAVTELRASGSFRSAEASMRGLIVPFASQLDFERLQELATAITSNDQIRLAADVPNLLVKIFDAAPNDLDMLIEWAHLSHTLAEMVEGQDMHYYSYPDLAERVKDVPI